jgi:hypothetical protein
MTASEKIRKHNLWEHLVYLTQQAPTELRAAARCNVVRLIAEQTSTTPAAVRNALRYASGTRGRPRGDRCPTCGTLRSNKTEKES